MGPDGDPLALLAKSSEDDIDSVSGDLVLDSKISAETFCLISHRKLTNSLANTKQLFIDGIRNLAEDARDERFRGLREAIVSLKADIQDLGDEILLELDDDAVAIPNLAFKKVGVKSKTTR